MLIERKKSIFLALIHKVYQVILTMLLISLPLGLSFEIKNISRLSQRDLRRLI